jgi:hypothetical protein
MKKVLQIITTFCVVAAPILAWSDTVVISSNMSAAGSDFVTTQTPDNAATWGYNWNGVAEPAGTGVSTVPASPNGDTVGLKLESNNTDDATDYQEGITVWCTTEPQTQNYDVEVDIFPAFPVTAPAAGTTELVGIVIQSNGVGVRGLRNNALSGCNPAFGQWGGTTPLTTCDLSTTASFYPQDGLAFGFDGDNGEAPTDIFCYDPASRTGSPSTALNGQTGVFQAGDPSPFVSHDFTNQFSYVITQPPGRTLGACTGWLWNHVKASVRGSIVTFYVNNYPIVQASSSKTAKRIGLLAGDPYASVSLPANESYYLFDNFKITDVTPSAAASDWQLFN